MKNFRSLRILLLALAVCIIPATSFAGVFVSVGFAPPILPVYEQPPCPEAGWIWTPGYWAYDEDGYYWVPGTWVPAPYEGALWTPPYWGWSDGIYVFHPGYWGEHVGYYGGVNYGFGYMGIGFVGGMWRGHDFVYNTAVVHVDERFVHTTYVDRTIVERNTIVNDRHVAFSGGPGGIHHDPRPEERFADHDRHVEATSFQHSHESAAMSDKSFYARNNGGHPNNVVVQRPMNGGSQQHDNNWNQGNQNRNGYKGSGGYPNGGNNNPAVNPGNGGNRNFSNAQPGNGNNQNRNFNNNPPPNVRSNQGGAYNPPANNENNQNRNNNPQPYVRNNQGGGYNPPPNNGNNQNHNSPQPYVRNNQGGGYNPNANRGNDQGRPAPQPQPQSRPAPPPQPQSRPAPPPPQQPQQHNDQGNHGDHGDHGRDRQH
jgi:hypothetical protein